MEKNDRIELGATTERSTNGDEEEIGEAVEYALDGQIP